MQRMKPLANDFDQVQRQRRIDGAMKSLNRHFFDPAAPKRLISGVALSSGNPNSKGVGFHAGGMSRVLPLPLLIDHDLDNPVGRVVWLECALDQIWFRAEVGNDMCVAHGVWADIIIKSVTRVSVHASDIRDMTPDGIFKRWRLDELSLTRSGADEGAVITRCSEKEPFICLNRPNEIVHWDTP